MSKPSKTIDTNATTPSSGVTHEGTTRTDVDNTNIFAELEAKRIGKGALPQVKRDVVVDEMSDGTKRERY